MMAAMPPRKVLAGTGATKSLAGSTVPEVILDFRFEQGLLYISLVNISSVPAYRVSVRFDKAFRGLGGECEISSLRLFRRVEFLAPQKRIETLLDSSRSYFQRREPTSIKAVVSFRDAGGRAHRREIQHDLKIYQDISYVVKREGLAPPLSFPPGAAAISTLVPGTEESTYGSLKRQTLLQFQLPR